MEESCVTAGRDIFSYQEVMPALLPVQTGTELFSKQKNGDEDTHENFRFKERLSLPCHFENLSFWKFQVLGLTQILIQYRISSTLSGNKWTTHSLILLYS